MKVPVLSSLILFHARQAGGGYHSLLPSAGGPRTHTGELLPKFVFFSCDILLIRDNNLPQLSNHPEKDRLQYQFVKYDCKKGSRRKSKSQVSIQIKGQKFTKAAVYSENERARVTDTLKTLTTARVPRKNIRKYIADSQGIIDMLSQDVYNLARKLSVCHGTESEG